MAPYTLLPPLPSTPQADSLPGRKGKGGAGRGREGRLQEVSVWVLWKQILRERERFRRGMLGDSVKNKGGGSR